MSNVCGGVFHAKMFVCRLRCDMLHSECVVFHSMCELVCMFVLTVGGGVGDRVCDHVVTDLCEMIGDSGNWHGACCVRVFYHHFYARNIIVFIIETSCKLMIITCVFPHQKEK